jgi:DNA replicative helicase MCM subunit Mcm2 (Cdc46/Mcm family)
MPDLKLVCDNCGSSFALSYDDEEVSYSPSHCPFCGDFYDNENEELDFNDDKDYGDDDVLDDVLDFDDEDDRRRH